MNKADGSKLRKKPYVSELLFLTLQQHKKKTLLNSKSKVVSVYNVVNSFFRLRPPLHPSLSYWLFSLIRKHPFHSTCSQQGGCRMADTSRTPRSGTRTYQMLQLSRVSNERLKLEYRTTVQIIFQEFSDKKQDMYLCKHCANSFFQKVYNLNRF